jgi:hypothetical protein
MAIQFTVLGRKHISLDPGEVFNLTDLVIPESLYANIRFKWISLFTCVSKYVEIDQGWRAYVIVFSLGRLQVVAGCMRVSLYINCDETLTQLSWW